MGAGLLKEVHRWSADTPVPFGRGADPRTHDCPVLPLQAEPHGYASYFYHNPINKYNPTVEEGRVSQGERERGCEGPIYFY